MTPYTGGCHCGAVRFEVRVAEKTALRCNCSICLMKGFVHVVVPAEDFTLVQGAEVLTTYTFNTHTARHTFCATCGVQAFYTPRSHPNGISAHLHCLDGDAAADFVVQDFDGAHWEAHIDSIRG